MKFFEAQEQARKSSRLLVWWFILAVITVILVMYLLTAWALRYVDPDAVSGTALSGWWDSSLFIWITVVVGGLILVGSLFKLSQLSAGGSVVAESMGGRLIDLGTRDLHERRLLNVVEEMAIASGMPIPQVWIMDHEEGINAFAAGTDPANAVIGVTRGAIERLDRSELQGVIAHEFSHILNGDMKLNMRLIGWIFGLVMLSMAGRMIFELSRHFRGSRDSKNGGIVIAIVVVGLVIWLVGSVGVLFARFIQAAISRQREFLADASAVQFTRYPDGIAGALKKIGGYSEHGKVHCAAATEARHMFFVGSTLEMLMATHPPLEKRIRAIDPNWNGELLEANPVSVDDEFNGAMGFAGGTGAAQVTAAAVTENPVPTCPSSLDFSKDHAKALLLGLLISPDSGEELAVDILRSHRCGEEMIQQIFQLSREAAGKTSAEKLALLDVAVAWLKRMEKDEAADYVGLSQALISADGQVDLFEFMLQQVIRRNVEIGIGLIPVPVMKYRSLQDLETEVSILLSAFAHLAGGEHVMSKAAEEYRMHTGRDLTTSQIDLAQVSSALGKMDSATPLVKQQILRMCSLVVIDDGKADQLEIELLRATAEAMGAPFPPHVRLDA
jgi:Zn-dependent protease with chaperone function